MKRLAIITALHGRYRMARLFLDYYRRLEVPGVELLLSCAVTTHEYKMRELVTKEFPEWSPVYAENMPLTTKFAANMENVTAWKPDAMMIVGSDDFVNAAYILRGLKLMEGADFIGGTEIAYLRGGTDQVIIETVGYSIGAGRILSRPLLEFFDWMPWKANCEKLDAAMTRRMSAAGIKAELITDYERHGCAMLDVKTQDSNGHDENRRSWGQVRTTTARQIRGGPWIRKYFPTIAEELLTW